MDFADRLIEVMKVRQMKQAELALRSGVRQGYLSMILAGRREPGIEIAAQLARGIDVSLDWLCGLPERQPNPLSPEEEELLRAFRALRDPDGRRMTLRMVRAALLPGE
jgi:transcriptional regulator with XRE-family HTH domain